MSTDAEIDAQLILNLYLFLPEERVAIQLNSVCVKILLTH